MERTTSFEQLSGVLGLVTHTFCPIAPDSGLVTWKGKEILKSNISKFREEVGFVGENICYYPTITLKKILGFMSRIYSN